MTTQTQRAPQRRVRHDVADGAAVMVFSLLLSVALAGAVAVVLAVLGGLW